VLDALLVCTLAAEASRRGPRGTFNELKSQVGLPKKRLTGTLARVLWAQRELGLTADLVNTLRKHIMSLGFDPDSSSGQAVDGFIPWLARELSVYESVMDERDHRGGSPDLRGMINRAGLDVRYDLHRVSEATGIAVPLLEHILSLPDGCSPSPDPLYGITDDELLDALLSDRDTWPIRLTREYRPEDVTEVFHWWRHPDENKPDIMTLRFEQALTMAEAWAVGIGEVLASRGLVPPGEVVYRWPDGWTVQEIPAGETLRTEGSSMQNCLRRGYYGDDVRSGLTKIYSLRAPAFEEAWAGELRGWSRPSVTMAVRQGSESNRILEIKGRQNKPPAAKYHERVLEFLTRAQERGEIVRGLVNDCSELQNMLSVRTADDPCVPGWIQQSLAKMWLDEVIRRDLSFDPPVWTDRLVRASCEGEWSIARAVSDPAVRQRVLETKGGAVALARVEGPSAELRRAAMARGGLYEMLDYARVEGPNDETRAMAIDGGSPYVIRIYAWDVDGCYRRDTALGIVNVPGVDSVHENASGKSDNALLYMSQLSGSELDHDLVDTALRDPSIRVLADTVQAMRSRCPIRLVRALAEHSADFAEVADIWSRTSDPGDMVLWGLMTDPEVVSEMLAPGLIVTTPARGGGVITRQDRLVKYSSALQFYAKRSDGSSGEAMLRLADEILFGAVEHAIETHWEMGLWALLWLYPYLGDRLPNDLVRRGRHAIVERGRSDILKYVFFYVDGLPIQQDMKDRLRSRPDIIPFFLAELDDRNSDLQCGAEDTKGLCKAYDWMVRTVLESENPEAALHLASDGAIVSFIAFCRSEPSGRWSHVEGVPQVIARLERIACSSPEQAIEFAKCVTGPSDVSRDVALSSPNTAFRYAFSIDGVGRDDTRSVAMRNVGIAIRYAKEVDGWVHPDILAVVLASGHPESIADLDDVGSDLVPYPGPSSGIMDEEEWVDVSSLYTADPEIVVSESLDLAGFPSRSGSHIPIFDDGDQIELFVHQRHAVTAWLQLVLGLDDQETEIVQRSMALWLTRPWRDASRRLTGQLMVSLPDDRLLIASDGRLHRTEIDNPFELQLGGAVWLPIAKVSALLESSAHELRSVFIAYHGVERIRGGVRDGWRTYDLGIMLSQSEVLLHNDLDETISQLHLDSMPHHTLFVVERD